MRRPPFTLRPLALSVTLVLSSSVALALDTPFNTSVSQTITEQVNIAQGAGTITTDNQSNVTQITGTVSGTGQLIKDGAGTLSLTADNSYTGGTHIQQGTLAASQATSLGSGDVSIANQAVLQSNQSFNLNNAIIIQNNTADLTQAVIDTNGNNNTLNGLVKDQLQVVVSGTLEEVTKKDLIVDGVKVGFYNVGKIRDANGVLSSDVFLADVTAQIGGQTIGAVGGGILVKEGDGRLVLKNNSNHQLATVINGGILAIDDQAALGTGTTTAIIQGTLQTLQNMTISKNIVTETASGGSINTAGSDVTVSGVVSGSGSLVKSGAGTLTLTADNAYNATKISGGTVAVSADTQLGTQAVNFIEAAGDEVAKRKLSNLANSSIFLDGGILQASESVTNKRLVNLGLAGGTISVDSKKTLTVKGLVTGGGTSGLVKEGEGVLHLSLEEYQAVKEDGFTTEGAEVTEQNFTGNTTIKAGVLVVDSVAKDLGKNTNVVLAGGDLRTLLSSNLAGLTLEGVGGAVDTTGTVTSVTGTVAGSGDLRKKGSGTLILTQNNSYTGDTIISEGKLQITSSGALGSSGELVFDGGVLQSAANLDLGTRKAQITESNGTIDSANQITIGGSISGEGQLIKSGSGTLTLTGENTFAGGVKIKEGTVEASSDKALGAATGKVIIDGATLGIIKQAGSTDNPIINREVELTDAGGTLSVGQDVDATFAGKIIATNASTSDLIKSGNGNLNFTADNKNLTADITVKAGTLGVGGGAVSADDNLGQGLLTLDGGSLRANANDIALSKQIVLNSQGGVDTHGKTNVVITGQITGTGTFVKSGEGDLALTGDNKYAGGTLIEKGDLLIASHANLGGTATGITLNGGNLKLTNDLTIGGADGRQIQVGANGGGINTNSHTVTISSELKGEGVLTKQGAGKLVLNQSADNDELKSGFSVDEGILSISKDSSLGVASAALTLNGGTLEATADVSLNRNIVLTNKGGTLDTAGDYVTGNEIVVNGKITGAGGLVVNGGTVVINNANNDYQGNTVVNDGSLFIEADSSLGAAGATLVLNNADLEGNNTNTIISRKIEIQGDGAGVFQELDKTLVLNGVVSGDATEFYIDGGTVELNAANTYTGDTHADDATLVVNNNASLGVNTAATVILHNSVLKAAANVTVAQNVELGLGALLDTSSHNLQINGEIFGVDGLTKAGTGTLKLTGANNYSGTTDVNAGILEIDDEDSLGFSSNIRLQAATLAINNDTTLSGDLVLNNGGTLDIKANTTVVDAVVTGTGGLQKNGQGTLVLSADNSYTGNTYINSGLLGISSNQNLGDASNQTFLNGGSLQTLQDMVLDQNLAITAAQGGIDTAGNNTVVNGVVSGMGKFVKSGDGELTVTADNTYQGGTDILGGTLSIAKDQNLGQAGTGLTINNAGLVVTADLTTNRAVTINNNVSIDTQTHDVALQGVIAGNANMSKQGTGQLALTGANTFVGNVDVMAGSIAINSGNSLGAASNSVNLASGTSLETLAALTAQQAINVTGDVSLNTSTFNSTLAGVVSGNGSIDKVGTGQLALTGANTFTGSVDVMAGSLAINSGSSLGAASNSVNLASGTSLETLAALTAQQAINVTGDVSINTSTFNSTLAGVVSGTANITKQGSGILNLQGVNTFVGDIKVTAGTLGLVNDNNLGAASNKLTLTDATLLANQSLVLNHQLDIVNQATLDSAANTLKVDSVVAGGRLVKTGTGVVELANANNAQSETVVNQGTLKVSNNNNLGVAAAKVVLNGGIFQSTATQSYARDFTVGVNHGTVDVLADTTVTLANTIDGAGRLNKTGAGVLVLAGNNSYQGGTAVNAGKLVISNAANLGTSGVAINNASLEATANVTLQNVALTGTANLLTDNILSIAGIISGTGSLVKQGTGNLELSGVNTYSGGTTLASGTLTLANGSSLGSGALTVQSGQVALKDGFVSTNNFSQNGASSSLTGNGTFANINVTTGQLTIANNVKTTNQTQITGGTLLVNGQLTSPITVGSSGRLGGSGTVIGNVNVNGTLSPGNSPATLNVTGDVNQNTGSNLQIEIDGATLGTGAGHYDQVSVSGVYNISTTNTTLEAKLRGITGAANNNFVPTLGQSFEVVKANAVNGTFANYIAPTTGLAAGTRLDIGYTSNSVRLYVTPTSFTSVSGIENATGAAKFLDDVLAVRDTSPQDLLGTSDLALLYKALLPANKQQLQAAMVSMSPAVYAESAQSVLALQQTLHNTQTLSEGFKKGGIALKALQQETDVDSDGNGIAATRSISGVQLSLDSEPNVNGWQMGAALSLVNKADIETQHANISLSGQDVTLNVRKQLADSWMLGAQLDIGSYEFDTKRSVMVVNQAFKTHQEGIKSSTMGVGINASRDMGNWQFNSGLRYNSVKQDGFAEAGNSLLKLTVADADQDQVVAMLGAMWTQTWKQSTWDIAPKLGLQLEQVLSGDSAQVNARLGSQMVGASASDTGKTLLRATVGVNFINVDGLSIGVDGSVEEGDNTSSTTGRLLFSKSF